MIFDHVLPEARNKFSVSIPLAILTGRVGLVDNFVFADYEFNFRISVKHVYKRSYLRFDPHIIIIAQEKYISGGAAKSIFIRRDHTHILVSLKKTDSFISHVKDAFAGVICRAVVDDNNLILRLKLTQDGTQLTLDIFRSVIGGHTYGLFSLPLSQGAGRDVADRLPGCFPPTANLNFL